jgi:hypothetical protein
VGDAVAIVVVLEAQTSDRGLVNSNESPANPCDALTLFARKRGSSANLLAYSIHCSSFRQEQSTQLPGSLRGHAHFQSSILVT